MSNRQVKCKIVIRLMILLFAVLFSSLISVIEVGFNIYKGIIIAASLLAIIIFETIWFKDKKLRS